MRVTWELVVGIRRVTLVEFRRFVRFQRYFLVLYRLKTDENLIRSSFAGETSIVNVSASCVVGS